MRFIDIDSNEEVFRRHDDRDALLALLLAGKVIYEPVEQRYYSLRKDQRVYEYRNSELYIDVIEIDIESI